MLDWVQDSAGWIVAVLGGLTALGVMGRWVRKRARQFARRWESARESLVGREEIRHPDTGVVLAPATPGLGQRLAAIEDNLTALSDTRSEMQQLTTRVDGIAKSLEQHISESAQVWASRAQAEEQMWKTIETIAQAAPPEWDGAERRAGPEA